MHFITKNITHNSRKHNICRLDVEQLTALNISSKEWAGLTIFAKFFSTDFHLRSTSKLTIG